MLQIGWLPGTVAQSGAALRMYIRDPRGVMRREFQRRRDTIIAALNAMPGFRCSMPGGAFYAFPNVQGALGRTYRGRQVTTSLELATRLSTTWPQPVLTNPSARGQRGAQ